MMILKNTMSQMSHISHILQKSQMSQVAVINKKLRHAEAGLKIRLGMIMLSFLLLYNNLFASPVKKVQEFTLENGMQVFLLEDSSDAQVHLEYSCRAGFSSQTQSSCGFFKLYTRLIEAAYPGLPFTSLECNSDSSRYFIDISPSKLEKTLFDLSDAVFTNDFSDEVLRSELAKLKKEVSDNAQSMSVYINAAIDSRVFSDAPWKHDSGIYPPLFKKTSEKTARSIIKKIGEEWYTPKNSAIFISGNINTERTLLMLRNSFGRFYSNYRSPSEKPGIPVNKQRKYVLHSNEISADLTQLVVQYTLFDMETADLLALALGYENSLFKQQVLSFEELNIPGDEYINLSAAHKKNSSRLIIQTLMQPPENKKKAATTNSFKQTELFLKQIDSIPHILRPEEFEYARKQLTYSLNRTAGKSQALMENLSAFWAVEEYSIQEEVDSEEYLSQTAERMMSRRERLREKSLEEALSMLQMEEPFIFVIINSKDYKANKKAYTAAGFEEINESNASWYVQAMFKNIKEEALSSEQLYTVSQNATDNSYYQKNLDLLKGFQLSNGIEVVTKENPLSEQCTLVLSVSGGRYDSYDDNGFEEVMINLTSTLIQKKLGAAQVEGLLTGAFNVYYEMELGSGKIIVEFDREDSVAVCRAISDAIVYGEIAPAEADRAVASRKYRKRLENGTAATQMYSALINRVFSDKVLTNIFESEKEILLDTDYTKILAAYPAMLNASRYTIILCGALQQNLQPLLEDTFGRLAAQDEPSTQPFSAQPKADFSKARSLITKVRHTFLTDIPAEKAGPQPAVLIPTTEFLDPVIYAGPSPELCTKEAALYNAILSYLASRLSKSHPVSLQFPRRQLPLGSLTIQNVEATREMDSEYKSLIQGIKDQMSGMQANQTIIAEIKNNWIQKEMKDSGSDTGTALLMQKGLELTGKADMAGWYLEEYKWIQNANARDYLEIMEYFPPVPQARVYSSDSKK